MPKRKATCQREWDRFRFTEPPVLVLGLDQSALLGRAIVGGAARVGGVGRVCPAPQGWLAQVALGHDPMRRLAAVVKADYLPLELLCEVSRVLRARHGILPFSGGSGTSSICPGQCSQSVQEEVPRPARRFDWLPRVKCSRT